MQHGNASNLADHLRILFALHNRRWSTKRQPGAVFDRTVESFLSEAALALAKEQILRSSVLWWNDEAVAAVFGFNHFRKFYFYLTGFEPRFAKFSFGSLSINAVIEAAIDEGCDAVDFLRGRESYKYRFGATEKRIVTISCSAKQG
jgi:CelD/BcsL family acetyltransferase involved in cellulose biosynthesis